MYSAFAQGQMQWGAQNECVWAVIPKVNYTPLMTARFTITHNLRDRIRLKAGISLDTARIYPESIHDFQIFQNQGNGHVMTGLDGEPGSETLEAGLD